jgi:uncharacterized protein YjbI with pentapeptide repeats
MRTVDSSELQKRLELHREWLDSQWQAGTRLTIEDAVLDSLLLDDAVFARASFKNVRIISTQLSEACLSYCELLEVTFVSCNLEKMDLDDAVLDNVRIEGSSCHALNLAGARVKRLVACQSDLAEVKLGKAELSKVDFEGASLRGAQLRRVDIEDSSLRGCDLSGANLLRARIARSDLRNLNFEDAEFERTSLSSVLMAGARGKPRVFKDVMTRNVDLSEMGDGSRLLQEADAAQLETYLIATMQS